MAKCITVLSNDTKYDSKWLMISAISTAEKHPNNRLLITCTHGKEYIYNGDLGALYKEF